MDQRTSGEGRASIHVAQSERGAALMLAIFVLATLSVVALYLGSQAQINRRIAGDDVAKSKALRYAEAGVAEALARIQAGQGPDPYAANAAQHVLQVLNTSMPGGAGPDTTLVTTGQPAGDWLPYSTSTGGSKALTIEFRTNAARTQIFKYDKSQTPPVQTSSGMPIFRITSTGRAGTASRTVVADVTWNPIQLAPFKGALAAGGNVKFAGNAISCGHNHRIDTPPGTGANGRTGVGGCNEDPSQDHWEFPAGKVSGIWSTGDATPTGAANAFGVPPLSNFSSPFYAGPWEVLGMSPAQFWAWVGPPVSTMPASPNGVYYLDNDATHQNASGSWSMVNGQGFLYVDGDLTLHDNWRGLVYVEGNLQLNGPSWILGAVICKGAGSIVFNGGATVLYSWDAINAAINSNVSGRRPSLLSWREI